MQRQSLRRFEDMIADQIDYQIQRAKGHRDDLMYEAEQRTLRINAEAMKLVSDSIYKNLYNQ